MPITFVGGIHGAGKTTLCRLLATSIGAQHLVAGQLISEGRTMAHSKKVADVDANQAALLTALVIHSHQSLDVILDGHFALLTASGITTISVDVFRAIDPSAIVVVTTDPRTASSRLAKRDGRHYAPDLLQSLQEQEIMQADRVARSLDVPFLHGPSFVTNELAAVIRGAHGRGRGT